METSNDYLNVSIAEGGHITMNLVGEEGNPIDLAPYAGQLLKISQSEAGLGTSNVETDHLEGKISADQVDFAILQSGDGVIFSRAGVPVSAEEGLSALADAVKRILISSVQDYPG
jgi:hypothetical protein